MTYDKDKVDNAALALLYLTLHDDIRAWKGLDWDVLDKLYKKGLIYDPKNRAKSVAFTPEGLEKAKEMFKQLFQVEDED